jgi:putative membrane protein
MTVLVGLLALQAAYLWRVRRAPEPVRLTKQLTFTSGVLVIAVALLSPLDDLADHYLFSAHMVQHLLLTLGAAPLLLGGTPRWLLRDLLRATRLTSAAHTARHPIVAFFVFNIVWAAAHLPAVYELALQNELLHALEHLLFVATAVLMWWPVLGLEPYPPMGQVLYLFLQSVPASLVGALLTHANAAYYATYVAAPRITSLNALEDQQLGALIMWVGSGIYFLLASAVVFFAWASREEAANRRPVGAL